MFSWAEGLAPSQGKYVGSWKLDILQGPAQTVLPAASDGRATPTVSTPEARTRDWTSCEWPRLKSRTSHSKWSSNGQDEAFLASREIA